jgi:hypothetical protein
VKRQSNVLYVEKYSVHLNNLNKNFGRKNSFFFLFSEYQLLFFCRRASDTEKASIHLGYSCHRCHACPIIDKCYKCTTCEDYFLCQTCFNLNIHNEHSFDYREVKRESEILRRISFYLEIISTLENSSTRTFNGRTQCTSSDVSQSRY